MWLLGVAEIGFCNPNGHILEGELVMNHEFGSTPKQKQKHVLPMISVDDHNDPVVIVRIGTYCG